VSDYHSVDRRVGPTSAGRRRSEVITINLILFSGAPRSSPASCLDCQPFDDIVNPSPKAIGHIFSRLFSCRLSNREARGGTLRALLELVIKDPALNVRSRLLDATRRLVA
jgi:hypothetical protein